MVCESFQSSVIARFFYKEVQLEQKEAVPSYYKLLAQQALTLNFLLNSLSLLSFFALCIGAPRHHGIFS